MFVPYANTREYGLTLSQLLATPISCPPRLDFSVSFQASLCLHRTPFTAKSSHYPPSLLCSSTHPKSPNARNSPGFNGCILRTNSFQPNLVWLHTPPICWQLPRPPHKFQSSFPSEPPECKSTGLAALIVRFRLSTALAHPSPNSTISPCNKLMAAPMPLL